jgi:orotate phosphoribosyltransferase
MEIQGTKIRERSEDEKRLFELFAKRSFLTRHPPEKPFKLASGGESYSYFDCRLVTLDPEGMNLIANVIYERISKEYDGQVKAIGGLETGSIPIAVAVSQLSYLKGKPIGAFFVRQNKKTHGTEKWIEGNLEEGSSVVIVEDVTTKGTSVEKAIQRVDELGCKVVEVFTLVDREEGAAVRLRKYKFTPIFKMSEFKAASK